MSHHELSKEMKDWLEENKNDYEHIAIDNQVFSSSAAERMRQIADSPHSVSERRELILNFCNHFNIVADKKGVPEAIRLIGEWQNTKN